MFAIGIDMSKLTFHACFDDEKVMIFKNTEDGFKDFSKELTKRKYSKNETKIGVESTGTYHLPFCLELTKLSWSVLVINPLIVNRLAINKIRPTKTDKIDAGVVRLAVLQNQGYIFNESLELLQLKSLISERNALVKMRAGLKQRISAEQYRKPSNGNTSYERTLKYLKNEIKLIENNLPNYQTATQTLLKTIPGIGLTSAAVLVATIGDISRFSTPRQFIAYIGLDCRVKESGTSIKGKGYLTKRGNRYLRFILFNATLIAKRYIPQLKEFYQKKKKEGHHHFSAMCATERKLALIVYAVWRRGAPFQIQRPTTQQPS